MFFSVIIMILILLALSAFFSASEIAYSSLNKIRIKRFVEEGRSGAKRAQELAKDFNHTISMILIGGNIVDIVLTAIATVALTSLFGPIGALYATFVATILIILFGEIVPKAIVKDNAENFAVSAAPFLSMLMKLLSPFIWVAGKATGYIHKLRPSSPGSDMPSVTHDELLGIVEDMASEGVLPKTERELIENAINFNELEVWEIQTPRVDLFAIDVNEKPEKVKNLILKNHYTRVPIYEGTTDNIIGILHEKLYMERLITGQPTDLRSAMYKPLLISGSASLMDALKILKTNRTHIAIVLDEYGGTSGIVTLEDLMEELMGEIFDELDDIKENVTQVKENVYLANCDIYVEDLFYKYLHSSEMPDTDAPTVCGWLMEEFKTLPPVGASLQWHNFKFEVVKVAGQRVIKVRITVISDEVSPAESPEIF